MKILSVQAADVTPEMAAAWLATLKTELPGGHEFQRRLREAHVDRLAREMRARRFPPDTNLKIGRLTGAGYLMNGRHRLTAVVAAGMTASFVVQEVEYTSAAELCDDYARTDIGAKRTMRDALRAHDFFPELTGDLIFLQGFAAAMKIRIREFSSGPAADLRTIAESNDLVIEAMVEYKPHAEALFVALMGGGERKKLVRAPVLAVALETFRYQKQLAEVFWAKAARDDGLRRGDPIKALIDWLKATPGSSATNRLASRACAAAWNAAWRGHETKYLQPARMEALYLEGTAWSRLRPDLRPAPLACVARELALQAAGRAAMAPARLGQRQAGDGRIVRVVHAVKRKRRA